jgi:hypothetical protein
MVSAGESDQDIVLAYHCHTGRGKEAHAGGAEEKASKYIAINVHLTLQQVAKGTPTERTPPLECPEGQPRAWKKI